MSLGHFSSVPRYRQCRLLKCSDTRVSSTFVLVRIVRNHIACWILCATKVWCCNLIICYLTIQYTYAGVASFRIKCFPLLETTPTYICGLELKNSCKDRLFYCFEFHFSTHTFLFFGILYKKKTIKSSKFFNTLCGFRVHITLMFTTLSAATIKKTGFYWQS